MATATAASRCQAASAAQAVSHDGRGPGAGWAGAGVVVGAAGWVMGAGWAGAGVEFGAGTAAAVQTPILAEASRTLRRPATSAARDSSSHTVGSASLVSSSTTLS